jgi:hypothetical protein
MDLTSVDKVLLPKPRFPLLQEEKPKSSTTDAMQLGMRAFRQSDQHSTTKKHMRYTHEFGEFRYPYACTSIFLKLLFARNAHNIAI